MVATPRQGSRAARRALAGPLAILCAVAGVAAARQPVTNIGETIGETIAVRVVNVEAVVTDARGERVAGLAATDFRLLVDGAEVPIAFFNEIHERDLLPAQDTSEPGQPVARGVSYLVFIDEDFANPSDLRKVLRGLRRQLTELRSVDRVSIVAWNGHRLDLLGAWTVPGPELDGILAEAQRRKSSRLKGRSELAIQDLDALRRTDSDPFRQTFLQLESSEIQAATRRLEDRLKRLVRALAASMRTFGSSPGRKAALVISGGWPRSPSRFVNQALGPARATQQARLRSELGIDNPFVADDTAGSVADDEARNRSGEEWGLYQPLVETANLLGFTFYPVDAAGFESNGGFDSAQAVPALSGQPPGFSSPADIILSRDLNRGGVELELEAHDTLSLLAEETGGVAYLNQGRNDALRAVAEDTQSYYWIGFSGNRLGDDLRHKIELQALVPRLEVRSRQSYTDLSREQEIGMTVESGLLLGQPAGARPLILQAGTPTKAALNKMTIPLRIRVPMEEIALLPVGAEEYAANLRLWVVVLDREGDRNDFPPVPVELRRSTPAEPATFLDYQFGVQVRRGHHEVVVALYDLSAETMWSSSLEVSPDSGKR